MTKCILQVVDTAVPGLSPGCEGQYVVDFEENDDEGAVVLTNYEDDAKEFDTPRDALEFWNQQSRTKPLRPDGRPNRPLTAFTMEVIYVENDA